LRVHTTNDKTDVLR